MSFWKTQFDKMLMTAMVVAFCAFAYLSGNNEKLNSFATFALQSAAGCLGCLLTLVTGRRTNDPSPFPSDTPTSSTVTASSKVETITKTEIPKTVILNGDPLEGPPKPGTS